MEWRRVVSAGDIIRIIASFLFINIMFVVFIPLDPVYNLACNLILFLALFITIRLQAIGK